MTFAILMAYYNNNNVLSANGSSSSSIFRVFLKGLHSLLSPISKEEERLDTNTQQMHLSLFGPLFSRSLQRITVSLLQQQLRVAKQFNDFTIELQLGAILFQPKLFATTEP